MGIFIVEGRNVSDGKADPHWLRPKTNTIYKPLFHTKRL